METPPPIPKKPSRAWVKWLIAGSCLLALLFITGVIGMVILAEHVVKSQSVYTDALAKANASSAVTNALGIPLKDGMFFSGNISEGTTTGSAHILIPINGPRGAGHLSVTATRSNSHGISMI